MPLYHIKYIQHRSGKAKPAILTLCVYFEKGTNMLQIVLNAAVYISEQIMFPLSPDEYLLYSDDMLSSYPINIEISYINTVRKFILKETKSEVKSFVKANDKYYTIIDQESEKPIALSRDMFYQYSKKIHFDIKDSLPHDKRPTPEILTPMGGAVKKK